MSRETSYLQPTSSEVPVTTSSEIPVTCKTSELQSHVQDLLEQNGHNGTGIAREKELQQAGHRPKVKLAKWQPSKHPSSSQVCIKINYQPNWPRKMTLSACSPTRKPRALSSKHVCNQSYSAHVFRSRFQSPRRSPPSSYA